MNTIIKYTPILNEAWAVPALALIITVVQFVIYGF